MVTIVKTTEGAAPIQIRNARSRTSLTPPYAKGTVCKVARIDRTVRACDRPLHNSSPTLPHSTVCLAVLVFLVVVTVCSAAPQLPYGFVACSNTYLLRNGKPFVAKGMNYYPRDAPWYRFWPNLNDRGLATAVSNDLDTAQTLGVNTVRLFLPYSQFTNSPANIVHANALSAFLNQLASRDMLAILTLFDLISTNDHNSANYEACSNHIAFVTGAVAPTNPVVLAWDLKNEPDRDWTNDSERTTITNWLSTMVTYLRTCDSNHPVTIGFYSGTNFDINVAVTLAESIDIVSMHYSLEEKGFPNILSQVRAHVPSKPIILEEFAIHTCTDPGMVTGPIHTEEQQIAYYNALLAHSEASELAGMLFWTLRDYSWLMPGEDHKQAHEGLIRLDGSFKPAAAVVHDHFAGDCMYMDRFDGYVDTSNGIPPVGWHETGYGSSMRTYGVYRSNDFIWPAVSGHAAISRRTGTSDYVTSPAFATSTTNQYPWLALFLASYTNTWTGCVKHASLQLDILSDQHAFLHTLTNISRSDPLPRLYSFDLSQTPLPVTGSFCLGFKTIPDNMDGYGARYELDWIRIGKRPADVCLTVESAHGFTAPPAGKWWFGSGDAVTVSVVKAVAEMDGTQYACTGWMRTGNSPASGIGTNMQIDHLTNDTTVTWVWTPTNYWLDIGVVGSGVVDRVSGWVQTSTVVTVTTTTGSTDFVFCGWCGDTNGCTITGTNIAVTMSSPRAIAPVFLRSSWLTTNDAMRDIDNDGIATWQEWIAGTDPTNETSYPRLTTSSDAPGWVTLRWTGRPDVAYRVRRSTSLTSPFWFKVLSTSLTDRTSYEVSIPADNEPILFHRYEATPR